MMADLILMALNLALPKDFYLELMTAPMMAELIQREINSAPKMALLI